MIINHVKNSSPSLRVYLQKTSIKEEVEQVEEQKLSWKINLHKAKVEHVEEQKLRRGIDCHC